MRTEIVNPLYGLAGIAITFAALAGVIHCTGYSRKESTRIDKVFNACNQNPATTSTHLVSTRNIDQVFRDHDGYRLYSQDNDGKVSEEKYNFPMLSPLSTPDAVRREFKGLTPDNHAQVNIYRDLDPGRHAFAKTLEYTVQGCFSMAGDIFSQKPQLFTYVEVHLPSDQGIAAGFDSWIQGKVQRYEPMLEIR